MSVPQRPKQDFQVEAVTAANIQELWQHLESSVNIWNAHGQLSFADFTIRLQKALCVVWFPFGVGYVLPGQDKNTLNAHLLIWSKEYFYNKGLISAACVNVMRMFGVKRIETVFPSQIRALHRIMRWEGFEFEGNMRKAITIGSNCLDASMYSKVKE